MAITILHNGVEDLKAQISAAHNRANEAWDRWDIEAFDGACETAHRLQQQLNALEKEGT